MNTLRNRFVFLSLLLTVSIFSQVGFAGVAVLENPLLRYEVTEAGRSAALIDVASGRNLLAGGGGSPVCTVQKGGATWESVSLSARDGLWRVGFGDAGVTVVLRPEAHATHVSVEVVSVAGDGVDQLNFLHLPLAARDVGDVAVTALALNLQTRVPELPGPMAAPLASCFPQFGFAGARAALIAAPHAALRETLQRVIEAEGLPHSKAGGPWALDAPITRGSYLIDTEGEIGEDNVEAWIALARALGMKQIDLHTGKSMRFGDLRPNPDRYPNGLDGVKAVVDKMRAAGLSAGLHTYAFYFAKDARWVTPTPDPRLAVAEAFTLDADIDAMAGTIPVAESTAGVSTVTGFQVRNSVTLRIGDELIVFSGANVAAPFGFTQCERGALGTTATAHARGARVERLKECFGLFAPDGDSTLLAEVAARTAEVYNYCGFEMIYLDALDGADLLAGGLNAWHYAGKFVEELNARLDRPALFEMSMMDHHQWRFRSRMGAWDVPARGMRRLADIHARANEEAARVFMPSNLGWSGVFTWHPVQPERTFPEDIEHLLARALAADSSLSLLVGFTPESWETSANIRRMGGIIRRYEDLRLSNAIPAAIRAQLRESGAPFVIEPDSTVARPRHTMAHTAWSPDSSTWTVVNPYAAQAPRVRVEMLAGLAPRDDARAQVLASGAMLDQFGAPRAAEGVTVTVEAGEPAPGETAPGIALAARNETAPRAASWGGVGMRFDPPRNLHNHGFGLWVRGDGSGAVLCLQLQASEAAANGRAQYYVDLDFTGWRYVELVEPESARLGDFGWPFSARHADWTDGVPFMDVLLDYIVWMNYGQTAQLNLWLNNVAPGASARCEIGSIAALPVRELTADDLALERNGARIVIPGALRSGDYVELAPGGEAAIYDVQGELRARHPLDATPVLVPGENTIRLESHTPLRVRVTHSTLGDAIIAPQGRFRAD
ncbi:MAG: hypothetical protein KF886_03250 [Candidatus Hydrogenedentes bacterium]|nr:hypothetical protein [Candidatus Hydrogenedentota bacterium]